jgi:hypothetical protein
MMLFSSFLAGKGDCFSQELYYHIFLFHFLGFSDSFKLSTRFLIHIGITGTQYLNEFSTNMKNT